jgi:hypothetical protein
MSVRTEPTPTYPKENQDVKKLFSISTCRQAALLCGVMLLAVLVVGCQTSGKVLAVSESADCPMCKTETRTTPIKGLTYKKHVCPGCRTITETDHYTGNVTSSVHVCDHCKAAVTQCPQCASK